MGNWENLLRGLVSNEPAPAPGPPEPPIQPQGPSTRGKLSYIVCFDGTDGAKKAVEHTSKLAKPEDDISIYTCFRPPSRERRVLDYMQPRLPVSPELDLEAESLAKEVNFEGLSLAEAADAEGRRGEGSIHGVVHGAEECTRDMMALAKQQSSDPIVIASTSSLAGGFEVNTATVPAVGKSFGHTPGLSRFKSPWPFVVVPEN